jgi:hypothetical protein
MGIRHLNAPIEGVQFHPESILTPEGPHLLANFLRLAGEGEAALLDHASGTFALAGFGGEHGAAEPAAAGTPIETANATEAAVAGRVEMVR